jgi:hypothetical protein
MAPRRRQLVMATPPSYRLRRIEVGELILDGL